MPSMIRTSEPAKKIAFAIIGTPAPLLKKNKKRRKKIKKSSV